MKWRYCTEVTAMLFSEVYSVYFNAVAAILNEAVSGEITDKRIADLAREKAFSESFLEVLSSLKNEEWLLLNKANKSPVVNPPRMPLTKLQKRWLAALLTDPRIRLFNPDTTGLDDIAPLFTAADFVYFDRYTDGDPYDAEHYINTFRLILQALTEKRKLSISFCSRRGGISTCSYIPYRLEYSGKDDKFRLLTSGGAGSYTINLARITAIELLEPYDESAVIPPAPGETSLRFALTDERNALERVLLHFSDCKKETRRTDDKHYTVTLWYNRQDQTEMVIRVLSFGQMLRVLEPAGFAAKIKERITRQKKLLEN
jgi:hypothetical protein